MKYILQLLLFTIFGIVTGAYLLTSFIILFLWHLRLPKDCEVFYFIDIWQNEYMKNPKETVTRTYYIFTVLLLIFLLIYSIFQK